MVLVAAVTGYAFPIRQPGETQPAPVWPEAEDLVFTYFKRQCIFLLQILLSDKPCLTEVG